MLPGHEVIFTDTGSRRPDTGDDTRQGFVIAEAERGPLFPIRCTSLAAVTAHFGARQSYSYLYDGAEAAFSKGCGVRGGSEPRAVGWHDHDADDLGHRARRVRQRAVRPDPHQRR
jgi:hypothetical protein